MPLRYDTARIDAIEYTPHTGAIRVPATLTRPGVFTYHDERGQPIREYRPAEEVYHADSLASYEDAPITIGHPPRGVSPATFQTLSAGHIRAGSVKPNGEIGVDARLVVSRGDAIARIENRGAPDALSDVSMGYDVEIDPTPGVTADGQAYDRVQRKIRVNHAALLKRGDGRISGAQLRLDGSNEQIPDAPAPAQNPKKVSPMIKIKRADGSEVEVEQNSAEHVAILEAQRDALQVRCDGLAKTQAERDAKDAAAARSELEAKAKSFGVEASRKDGDKDVALTDREIKVAVIKRQDASFVADGREDAYVQARFDIATTTPAPAAKVAEIVSALNETKVDANDPRAVAEAAELSVKDAWKR